MFNHIFFIVQCQMKIRRRKYHFLTLLKALNFLSSGSLLIAVKGILDAAPIPPPSFRGPFTKGCLKSQQFSGNLSLPDREQSPACIENGTTASVRLVAAAVTTGMSWNVADKFIASTRGGLSGFLCPSRSCCGVWRLSSRPLLGWSR